MAIRLLWRYLVGRARTIVNNYNVIERAEKVLEYEKKPSPRHPGTEAKFRVLVQGKSEIRKELEQKPKELLDRLKVVKVTSEGQTEDPVSKRPLPQDRQAIELPTFGFEEPKHIPQGKCSLRQALSFITKHQDDSKTHSVKSIAEEHSMKEIDVENIVKYFRVFEIYISTESKTVVAKSTLESLGIGKVVTPMFKPKFAHLDPVNIKNELPEKK